MLGKYKSLIYKTIIAVVLILLSIAIYIYFTPIRDVINLLLISFIIAYTLKPLRNFLSQRFNISAKKSSLLIILLVLLAFIGLLYCIVPSILKESGNFGVMLDSIEEYVLALATRFKLDRLPVFETVYLQVGEKINMILSNASTNLVDNMISLGENIVGLAVVPITTYYLLADGHLIYNKLLLVFPTDKRVLIKNINNNIDKILSRYILSQLLLSLKI